MFSKMLFLCKKPLLAVAAFIVLNLSNGQEMKIPDSEPINRIQWSELAKKTIDNLKTRAPNLNRARNVVVFLGDGMGVSTLTAARIVKAQSRGYSGPEELLAWDQFPHSALIKTYNTDKTVPDSAGTATAYLTGAKTRKGVIGFDERVIRGECLTQEEEYQTESFMTAGSRDGRAVGVVTTARLTHASPAAAYAHVAEREWEANSPEGCEDVAMQLVNGDHGMDVFLGGGLRNFIGASTSLPHRPTINGSRADGKNLLEAWREKQKRRGKKAEILLDKRQMDDLDEGAVDAVLGLFAPSHMTWDAERDPTIEPSLAEMTVKAVQILQKQTRSKEKGFLLFVEGGRIDHGHHYGTAKKALTETVAMEKALVEAMEITSENETLFIVTADHSHTFALAGYPRRTANIFNVLEEVADDGANYTSLLYANGPGHRPRVNLHFTNEDANNFNYTQDAAVPLKKETHGGEDVALLSKGPHSHLFAGIIEQSTIPHIIAYAACIEGFGSEALLLNAAHCASSGSPEPGGFDLAWLTIVIPVAAVLLAAFIGIIFAMVKHHKQKRKVGDVEEIPLSNVTE